MLLTCVFISVVQSMIGWYSMGISRATRPKSLNCFVTNHNFYYKINVIKVGSQFSQFFTKIRCVFTLESIDHLTQVCGWSQSHQLKDIVHSMNCTTKQVTYDQLGYDGMGVSSDVVRALYIIRQLGIWWVKFFTLSNLQCKLPKNQENCFFSKSQPLQTLTCFSGIHNEKSQQLIIYMLFSTAYH